MSDADDNAKLPPDLARKVLGADLRNIVKKAGEGATLSGPERKIVQEFLEEKSEPEELLAARRNALIARWASGGKLSATEFAEIEDHLPVEVRIENEEESAIFEPVSELKPEIRSHGRYPKKQAFYADFYGYKSTKTIKRWIAKGRAADSQDFPPLDSPELMPTWYRRHHKQKVPENLIDRANQAEQENVSPPDSAEETPKDVYHPPSELPDGSGFAAELARLWEDARKAAGVLADAEESKDPVRIERAQRQRDRALKVAREYQRDSVKIMQSMGDLVEKAVMEQILHQKHATIRSELETLVNRVHGKVDAEPVYEKRTAIWLDELHKVLRKLESNGFGDQEPFELEAAA